MKSLNIFKSERGETIPEALVTFLISSMSIVIIATSIVVTQKNIALSNKDSFIAHEEKTAAEEFIMFGEVAKAGENTVNVSHERIFISSNGYLHSEIEVEFAETINKRLKAFR